MPVTRDDKAGWLRLLWGALDEYNWTLKEGDPEWDELCTVMAWIAEELGLDPSDPSLHG